jgi:uncharacterized phage protein gp47/JayE
MGFKSLTETQIVANLIDTYTSLITTVDDLNVGSNIRSIFEAFAHEVKRLYQNTQESASETQKMAAYTMFNFPLNPSNASYTTQTFTTATAPSVDTIVPAGTTVGVLGTSIQFKTQYAMTWPALQTTFQGTVVCTQTGSIGNRRANEVAQLVTPIAGISGVTTTNALDIRTGSDLETSDQRANRFQKYVNSLHRGDINALTYGAKQAQIIDSYGYISEQVTKAQLIEGSGSNTIKIDNGTYNSSAALITQCQAVINGYIDTNGVIQIGYKAAGIPTTVSAATIQSVTVTISATPKPGYTFAMIQQSIIDSVTSLFLSLDVGDTLYLASLRLAIGNVSGVINHLVSAPTLDVAPTSGTLLKLGTSQPTVTLL